MATRKSIAFKSFEGPFEVFTLGNVASQQANWKVLYCIPDFALQGYCLTTHPNIVLKLPGRFRLLVTNPAAQFRPEPEIQRRDQGYREPIQRQLVSYGWK